MAETIVRIKANVNCSKLDQTRETRMISHGLGAGEAWGLRSGQWRNRVGSFVDVAAYHSSRESC